jgi:hypothetical protein
MLTCVDTFIFPFRRAGRRQQGCRLPGSTPVRGRLNGPARQRRRDCKRLSANKQAFLHDQPGPPDGVRRGVPTGNFGVPGRQPRVATLYSNGTVRQLGTLGGPATSTDGPESSVTAVNNNGQAVGWSTLVPENFNNPSSLVDEAFFWDGSSLHPIQMQDAAGNTLASIANSLNDAGEAVGYFYTTPVSGLGSYFSLVGARAFYYSNGRAVDLNTLLVNPPQGLVLATATYINNSGQILASAVMPDGSQPTYLLTPVDRPASPVDSQPRRRR